MTPCTCRLPHRCRRIVLTGGPGAGKTAVLELVRQAFCRHMVVLPEAAGIVFGGGFPRGPEPAVRKAGQRAIYFVQHELEAIGDGTDNHAIVVCDRGTIDGEAYWPGPEQMWATLGTTRQAELARYDLVIHLRTPPMRSYNHSNPLRIETAAEAAIIDARIARAWDGHPNRQVIDSTLDFLTKAQAALEILRREVPACCQQHHQLRRGGAERGAVGSGNGPLRT